ncbi:hypothetical protein Pcinc_030052 [Petrolisthes cinctipes]|uniref:Uncharacterized protein n=1 Tax=Petrolisthes cinctipes TaxID=88211 RepID=A0AAE1K519_PETCI|nr:hypothetical protein Pcinc_030052 [Petrolisthes cinctipes]
MEGASHKMETSTQTYHQNRDDFHQQHQSQQVLTGYTNDCFSRCEASSEHSSLYKYRARRLEPVHTNTSKISPEQFPKVGRLVYLYLLLECEVSQKQPR